jgi:1,4-alpha-glucan branching enzyme
MRRRHDLPFGPEVVAGDAPTGMCFRLWAPRATSVALVLDEGVLSPRPNASSLSGEGVKPRNGARVSSPAFLRSSPGRGGQGGGLAAERPGAIGGAIPMRAEPDGWWSVITDRAASGSRYRYRVNVGDYPNPASRDQPDRVHGPGGGIDPGAYRWSDTGWRGRAGEDIASSRAAFDLVPAGSEK